MGHSSYSCSYIPVLPGGATIQRSDLTLKFSEIFLYIILFLLPSEQNKTSLIHQWFCKTKENSAYRMNKSILIFPQYVIKCNTLTYVLLEKWF